MPHQKLVSLNKSSARLLGEKVFVCFGGIPGRLYVGLLIVENNGLFALCVPKCTPKSAKCGSNVLGAVKNVMNIVISGAGTVGRYLAEVLCGAGHDITVIEQQSSVLQALENELDIRTLRDHCAHGAALHKAGVANCDMYVAATNNDEVNLLSTSVASSMGARCTVARIHHRAYFDKEYFDFQRHFGIDHIICPEYATAVAIAQTLRNPGALAVEIFARGEIEMQELRVSDKAKAVGSTLAGLALPAGVRIATVTREEESFIPNATTTIERDDVMTLVGEKKAFEVARKLFQPAKSAKKHVAILGESSMGVWLCRALRQRHFSVRIFVFTPERAEELAAKLPHVTVIQADPTESAVFDEEHVADVDAFVALTDDDEQNILAAAQAKSLGAKLAIAVTSRSTYLHLLTHVGIDQAFSPRTVAAREIQLLLETGPIRVVGSLKEAMADVYEIRVGKSAPATGAKLKDIKFPGPSVLAAIQRGDSVCVPTADTAIEAGDDLLVIGRREMVKDLKKVFCG